MGFWLEYYLIIGFLLLAGVKCLVLPKGTIQIKGGLFTLDVIDPLRPILIFLVIASHCDTMTGFSNPFLRMLHMGTPAVAFFFFISGYGLKASYEKKGPQYLQGFLRRSIVKLFVPTLLAMMAYQVVYCFWGNDFFSLRSWVAIRHGYLDCFLPHCWFVFAICFLYMTFAVAYGRLRGHHAIIVVSLVILVYMIVFKQIIGTPFCWWLTPLAFVCGLIYRQNERNIVDVVVRFTWKIYFLLAAAYAGAAVATSIHGASGLLCKMAALSVVGPLVALGLLVFPIRLKWKWWLALAGVSFEIYLIHGIPKELFAQWQLSPIVYLCLVYTVSIVLAFGLKKISTPIKDMLLIRGLL